MILVKLSSIPNEVWINPQCVSYVHKNSDGDVIVGCGDEHFVITSSTIEQVVNFINNNLTIESAFSKVH